VVAAGLPRGDGEVFLDVGEEADRKNFACRFVRPHAPQERERLEAGRVEVEDEQVGRGLSQRLEQSPGVAGECRLDPEGRGRLGNLALEQKIFYGRKDSSRHVRLRAVVG